MPCSIAMAWCKRATARRHKAMGTTLSPTPRAQRAVVRRLQGRVQARQRPILLPPDRHRPGLALHPACAKPLQSTREESAVTAFQRLFQERGLPDAIRTDNGLPFASPQRPLQSLQALRLVAQPRHRHRAHQARQPTAERPPRAHASHPEDRDHPAARHEQPPAAGPLRRLRPRVQPRAAPRGARHEGARRDLRTRLQQPYRGLPEIDYPFHDRDVLVTACGRICMHRKKINISTVLAGQRLGIKEVDDGIWLVTFMPYDLGYIDLEQKTLQPSTTRSAQGCHPCLRYNLLPMCPGRTHGFMVVGVGDLEPPTPASRRRCSTRLSYTPNPRAVI